jgi:hypothetical protein
MKIRCERAKAHRFRKVAVKETPVSNSSVLRFPLTRRPERLPAVVAARVADRGKLRRSIKTSPSDRLWVTLDQLNIMARSEIEDVTKSSGKQSIKACVSDPH